ncbi:hypothetical protein MLD38_037496 [Melastoma candidum]|uniref:Uncharacterized protein n=1 Tax=Melastoma candidum TaxID=119954 RepID=A0ACB9LPL8_9MYRT|nr:hypothetical protein MLD38_037496 [Melastoma candidum]
MPDPEVVELGLQALHFLSSGGPKTLFVRSAGAKDNKVREDVLFIHGFISSSQFWTETVFPNFSDAAKSAYRLLAIDLLVFGKCPKPSDSFYTHREHVRMIEQTVPYRETTCRDNQRQWL